MTSQSGVKVCIRARPLINREAGSETYWDVDTHQIKYKNSKEKKIYSFDRVFSDDESTSDVYEEIVEPIVESAMQGFNGTIFAYGQTASGKTYTMLGSPECPGVIPLAIEEIFSTIEKTPEREFLLRMSYLEIYNENLKDLLAEENAALTIREDVFKNVKVSGLVEVMVTSQNDVRQYLAQGEKRRHMGATNMNDRSSRSHTICKVVIESRERMDSNSSINRDGGEAAVKVAQLNLVDLAGSERASQTGAEGQRFKEGCFINKSLMVLGQVINQICKDNEVGGGSVFISFRDSKLTRILQPSLGGNSLTAIICTVTLAVVDETESTLRFASSAKNVKNKPIINEVVSEEALLFRQKREINQLRKKIEEMEKQQEQSDISLTQKHEYEDKIETLTRMLLVSSRPADYIKKQQKLRRETWCPGAAVRAVHSVSPATDGSKQSMQGFSSINHSIFLNDLFAEEKSRLETPTSHAPKHRLLDDTALTTRKRARFEEVDPEKNSLHEKLNNAEKLLQEEREINIKLNEQILISEEEFKDKLEKCNSELKSAREKYQENNAENLQAQIRKLTSDIKMQDNVIEEFVAERHNEAKEREVLTSQNEELCRKVIDLERRALARTNGDSVAFALQSQVDDLSGQLREACREKRQLQEQFDSEADKSRDLNATIEKLFLDITEVKEKSALEIEEYKCKMLSLQSQLEATLSSTKTTDCSEKGERDILELEKELCSKDELIVELQESIKSLERKVSQLEFEISTKLSDEDDTLKEEDESVDKNTSHALRESFTKEGEKTQILEEALKHCELLANDKEAIKRQMDEMVFKLMEKEKEISNLQEQVQFNDDEKLVLLEEEKQFTLKIEKLKETLENEEKNNRETILKYMEDIKKLKEQLHLASDKEMVSQLQEDMATYEKSASDAAILLQDSNRELSKSQSRVDELEEVVKKQKSELCKLEADLESYQWMNEMSTNKKSTKNNLERSLLDACDSEPTIGSSENESLFEKLRVSEEMVAKLQEDLLENECLIKSLEEQKDILSKEADVCRLKSESLVMEQEQLKAQWSDTTELHKSELQSTYALLESLQRKQSESQDVCCQATDDSEKELFADMNLKLQKYNHEIETLKESLITEQTISQDLTAVIEGIKNETAESTNANCIIPIESEPLMQDLAASRKKIAELVAENEKLKESMLHTQGALLAENNKELDQQRLLDKADQAKKDSLEIFAQERERANKEINKLNHLLEEKLTALAKALSEKDIAEHHADKLLEQYNDAVSQVNELQNTLDGKNRSTFFSMQGQPDSRKQEKIIKQLQCNLDLTKQKLAKSEESCKSLQDEVRKLESEYNSSLNSLSSLETLKSSIKLKDDKIQELQRSFDKQKSWMQQQVQELLMKKECLEENILKAEQALQAAKAMFNKQIESLKNDISNHELSISSKENEIKTLKENIDQLQTIIQTQTDNYKEEKASLEQQHHSSVQSLESQKQNLEDCIAKKESFVDEKIRELTAAYESAGIDKDVKIEKLSSKVEALEQEQNELVEKLKTKDYEVVNLISSHKERCLNEESKIVELNCMIQSLQLQLQESVVSMQKKDAELTRLISDKEDSAHSEILLMEDLKTKLQSLEFDKAELLKNLEQRSSEITCIRAENDEKLATMKQELERQLQTLADERLELNEAKDKVKVLQDQTKFNQIVGSEKVVAKETVDLQEELDVVNLDNRRKAKEIETLQQSLTKYEQDFLFHASKLQEVSDSLQAAEKEIKTLKAIANEKKCSENQRDIDVLASERLSFQQQLEQKCIEIEELKTELKASTNLVASLNAKISDFERVLDSSKIAQVKLLEDQQHLSEVEKNFVLLYNDFTQLTEKYEALSETQLKFDDLQRQSGSLQEMTEQYNSLKEELLVMENRLIATERESDQLRHELAIYKEEMVQLEFQCDRKNNVENSTAAIVLSKDEDKLDSPVLYPNQDFLQLQKQLEELNLVMKKQEEEIFSLRKDSEMSKKELMAHKSTIEELSSQKDECFNTQSDEKSLLEEKLRQTVSKLSYSDQHVIQLKERCSHLELQLSNLETVESKAMPINHTSEAIEISIELSELKSKFSEVLLEMDDLNRKLQISEEKIPLLQARYEHEEEEKLEVFKQVSRLREVSDQETRKMKNTIEEQHALLSHKDEKIEELKENVLKKQQQIQGFESELAAAIEASKEEIIQQTEQNTALFREALFQSKEETSSNEMRFKELEALISKYSEDIKAGKTKIESLEKSVSVEKSEKHALQEQSNELQGKLEVTSCKITQMNTEIEKLKEENNKILAANNTHLEESNSWNEIRAKATERIRYLEGLLRDDDTEFEKLKSKISQLEKSNEEMESKLKIIDDSKGSSEGSQTSEVKELKEYIEKMKKRIRYLEGSLGDGDTELKRLKSKVSQLEKSSEELKSKSKIVAESKGSSEGLQTKEVNDMKEHVEKMRKRIRHLEGLVRDDDTEFEKLNCKIAQLEKENKEMKIQRQSSADGSQDGLVKDLQKTLDSTHQSYKSRILALEEQLSSNEVKMHRLKEQLRVQAAQHDDSIAHPPTRMATRSTGRCGGFVEKTKLDIQELEMIKLKQKQQHLEKELAKYMDIEEKRKSENQCLLDKNNKLKRYIREMRATAQNNDVLSGKSQNISERAKDKTIYQEPQASEDVKENCQQQ